MSKDQQPQEVTFDYLYAEAMRDTSGAFGEFWPTLSKNQDLGNFMASRYPYRQVPISPANYGHLIPRPPIYLIRKNDPAADIEHFTEEEWQNHFDYINTHQREELAQLLETRLVSTYGPQRYMPLLSIINRLGLPANVVADFGSSVSLGITGITDPEKVADQELVDHTGLWDTRQKVLQPPKKVLSFDIQPRDPEWTVACYHPKWINTVQTTISGLQALADKQAQNGTQYDFHQTDLTSHTAIPPDLYGTADIVHASLLYYLLDTQGREVCDENALRLLKPGGVYIQSDKFDDDQALFDPLSVVTIMRRKESHGGFGQEYELIKYRYSDNEDEVGPSDSFKNWHPGRDFDLLEAA